jgi:hypothetical protein
VLVLAFMMALDPLRLAVLLLLITRPRPVQSLFAYWIGAMTASVPYMLVPLAVLHLTPRFTPVAQHLASQAIFGSPSVRHIQFGIGVFTLLVAALMAVRFRVHQRAYLPTQGGTTSIAVRDPNTPTAFSQPLGLAHDAPTGRHPAGAAKRSRFWDLVLRGRARVAWDNGASWVSVVIGLASGPPPLTVLLVLTTIMASGAAIGTQVGIAMAWIVGMFAIVEIILVSYLASPTKTETALRRLHDWILPHRRQVWIAMIAVVGVVMLAYGMGVTRVGG